MLFWCPVQGLAELSEGLTEQQSLLLQSAVRLGSCVVKGKNAAQVVPAYMCPVAVDGCGGRLEEGGGATPLRTSLSLLYMVGCV